jgi:hypothetical protein
MAALFTSPDPTSSSVMTHARMAPTAGRATLPEGGESIIVDVS